MSLKRAVRSRNNVLLPLIAAVLSLGSWADAKAQLHAQFTGAQSVLPTGSLSYPYRCAVDAGGNVYISDTQGNKVLKETLENGLYTESVVVPSSYGLATPYGIAVDASGVVYIADNGHNRIVKATPSGNTYTASVVSTTSLYYPTGLAVDSSGTLYIADTGHGRIVKETPSGNSYTETLITAGSNFAQITGITVDGSGNLYVSDIDHQAVYKETYAAGSYTPSTIPTSGLNYPYDLAADAHGNVYISDFTNRRIVLETSSGGTYSQSVVPTFGLSGALGLAVDANDNLYIADTFGFDIKEVSTAGGNFGLVNVGSSAGSIFMLFDFQGGNVGDTLAATGTAEVTQGAPGQDFSSSATGSGLCSATSYSAGNSCAIAVKANPVVPGLRMGSAQLIGSSGVLAQGPLEVTGVGPQVNFYAPDDFFAAEVLEVAGPGAYSLTKPFDAAVDPAGNVFVADSINNAVYEFTLSGGLYTQTTIATNLNGPEAVALDGAGNVYICDSGNNQILKETNVGGTWTGQTILTGLNFPVGIAVDWLGNVYYSSLNDSAVYKETLSQGAFTRSTVSASLLQPRKIALDGSGNVYIADSGNSRVVLETLLPGGGYAETDFSTGMQTPYAVAVDASGSIYVSDIGHERILKESLSGGVWTQSTWIPGPIAYGLSVDGYGNLYFPDVDQIVFEIGFNVPLSLSFGGSQVGTQSSDSPQSLLVFNSGNAPLSLPPPGTGSNPALPAGFALDASSTCPQIGVTDAAGSLAAGANCTYAVDFIPIAVGSNSGSLVLSDNTLNQLSPAQSTALTGTGNPAATTTLASSATAGYSPNAQSLALSATVTSGYGTVNAGTVTFTLLQGSTVIGSPATSATLSTGAASVIDTLPGGTDAGTYTIQAVFNAGGAFATSSDTSQSLVISQASQSISFTPPTTPQTFSPGLTITLTATGGSSNNAVTFTLDGASTGTGTITGSTLTVTGAGTIVIDANQAGNTNYSAATQAQATVVINKAPQTISFTPPTTPQTYSPGLTIALSATGGGSNNAVTLTLDGASTGTGTITGSTLTVTGAGTIVIDANQAGNTNYSAAAQAQATVVINKASQTISFTPPTTPQTYSPGLTIALTATGGGSNNAVTLTLDGASTGTGTITGSTLTVTGAGTIVIDANQAGNTNYSAATQAQATVVINKAPQTISFTPPTTPQTYSPGLTIALTATGGASNNAVTFTLDGASTGTGTITGSSLTVTGAGTFVVDANQAGNSNYAAATQAQATVVINKAPQTISFTPPATPQTYGAAPLTLSATGGGSGNPVVFSVVSGPGSVSGSTLTISGAGTIVVAANQAGNADYAAAAQVTTNIVVNQATPTVVLVSSANPVVLNTVVTFTANVASMVGAPGGSVNFLDGSTLLGTAALSSGAASLTTSNLSATTHSITAVYSGDTNFASVTSTAVSELVQDFSFVSSGSGSSSQTALPGQTATYNLALGLSNGTTFPVPVTLSLTGLPPEATATITPNMLVLGPTPSSVTLTIQLPQAIAILKESRTPGRPLPPVLWGILLLPFATRLRRKAKRLGRAVGLMFMTIGIAAVLGMSGCGSTSGFFGQQPQTYNVTITATSGSLSHSITLNLTVE